MEKSNKKTKIQYVGALLLAIIVCVCLLFGGCSIGNTKTITSIEKTGSSGLTDTYTITYSDGSTYNFYVENGKDGTDATSPTIQEIYNQYVALYGEISFADFLQMYLKTDNVDNSAVINKCLQSCLKIYTEFAVTSTSGWPYQTSTKAVSISCGSGVVYQIDNDYTYILTNYHVVYSASANADNGGNIAKNIHGYLYGSDGTPTETSQTNNGYKVYDYGDYAIEFEYVGGSVNYDIAILKAKTSDVVAINENVKAVTLADSYHVGQTAIAIGNPENEGISATEGIVSVDNEFINLNIDGTTRSYRSLRIDTAIYEGSSGGGLFNSRGELIGLTNAGDNDDQNVNYAIPLDIVKNVVNNIMRNYDGTTASTVKKPKFGVTIDTSNSKYVYDETTGYGYIKETISVDSVTSGSIFETLGLQSGDVLVSIVVNDNEITLNRYYEIDNVLLQLRANDTVSIKYKRAGETAQTDKYTIVANDFVS